MEIQLDPATLGRLTRRCLEGVGVPAADAEAAASVLLYASLRGIESHGVSRLPAYMRQVRDGAVGGTEAMRTVSGRGSLEQLDAGSALGPAAAVRAIDRAIELAREHGVGVVALGNSNHFGAAGFYAARAAETGAIGIVASNGPSAMAPYGAAEAFLGSNPLAIAAPIAGHPPMVLDLSSTITARGRIIRAAALGESIESGLALGPDGRPTTDPEAALAGSVLPMAGPKGSGLAFAIALLVTSLAGATPDHLAGSMYARTGEAQGLGQLFAVIDPGAAADRAEGGVLELVEGLHRLAPREGFAGARYPGEGAAARARARERSGIPLEVAELEALVEACSECGLAELGDELRSTVAAARERSGG